MRTRYLTITLVLFLLGTLAAGYLVWHHYALITGSVDQTFCAISQTFDCDAVSLSEYATIAGIPLATLALSYFLFASIVTAIALAKKYSRREALVVLLPFSLVSVGAAVAAASISTFLIKKVCIVCLAVQVISIATFFLLLVVLADFFPLKSYFTELQKIARRKIITYLVTIAGIFVVVHAFSSSMEQQIPLNEQAFLAAFRAETPAAMPADVEVNTPTLGVQGDNAPVQLVEFSDFQCPYCAVASSKMSYLVKRYGDRIQLVFKHFPLDQSCNPHVQARIHDFACLAARAAHCAYRQDKFDHYHRQLFKHAREINQDSVREWARESGLDLAAFDACLQSGETRDALLRDMDLATRLGVQSTPTFFVNGRRVEGVIDEARLKLILKELGK